MLEKLKNRLTGSILKLSFLVLSYSVSFEIVYFIPVKSLQVLLFAKNPASSNINAGPKIKDNPYA